MTPAGRNAEGAGGAGGALVAAGKTGGGGIAAQPSAEFDADWGRGFMKPDQWIGIVYDGMTKN